MANFNVKTNTSQSFTLVDPADYTHKVSGKVTESATRSANSRVDNFRHEYKVTQRLEVAGYPKCDKACGIAREEVVTTSFVVSAGQNSAYYVAKANRLKEMAAILTQAANSMNALATGGMVSTTQAVVA